MKVNRTPRLLVAIFASIVLLLVERDAHSQTASLFSSPQALEGGDHWAQAIGVTSIVFGQEKPRADAEGQIVLFTGLLKITKLPVTTLSDGRKQIELRFDSRLPPGSSPVASVRSAKTTLGYVKVAVDPDEVGRSIGRVIEIPFSSHPRSLEGALQTQSLAADHDHESGHGHAELFLVFEPGQDWRGPAFRQLRNREPVILSGHIHSIPPITAPISLKKDMTAAELRDIVSAMPSSDKWVGANKEPIALVDENGQAHAWFTANLHVTTLTGVCNDGIDNDNDGKVDEELPNNIDDDGDGYIDEDTSCPGN